MNRIERRNITSKMLKKCMFVFSSRHLYFVIIQMLVVKVEISLWERNLVQSFFNGCPRKCPIVDLTLAESRQSLVFHFCSEIEVHVDNVL